MTALQTSHSPSEVGRAGWALFVSSLPRVSPEVQKDQTATATVGLASAAIGAAGALLGQNTTAAVFAGLLTLCIAPGCGFVCWLVIQDRLNRWLTVLAASLTWSILATTILALQQDTSLGVLVGLTAGVGGLGSAVFLLNRLISPSARDVDAMPAPEHPAGRDQVPRAGYPRPRLQLTRPDLGFHPLSANRDLRVARRKGEGRNSQFLLISLFLMLAVAILLFAMSVVHVDGHSVGRYGLLPLLGAPFFISAALTVAVFALALRYIRTAWPVAVLALVLLLVEFSATPMIIDATPFSSWTFKHYGVVDYIYRGLPLNDSKDIYQQWPGFFAIAAGLVRLSGRSALDYANWAQLFFLALDSVAVFAIARRFAPKNRVVPYVAVALFSTAIWEGQFYYSPQSTGYLLALLFQFLLLPLLEPSRLRRLFRRFRRIAIPSMESKYMGGSATAAGGMVRNAGLIALFAAILLTHQLTPYMIFGGLACLWLIGVFRRPWLILVLMLMVIGYPVLHISAVTQNSLLDGFQFSNTSGRLGSTSTTPEQHLASLFAKAISLGIWAATAASVLSYWRRLGTVVIPAILAAVPLGFVLVSNYGGEGIYRVFLFSSPWCALILAKRLVELNKFPILCCAAVGCWSLFAAVGSAQSQDFGMYGIMAVPESEINASTYFLNNAPSGTALILVASDFPSRVNARYVLHNPSQNQNDLGLDNIPQYLGDGLSKTSAKSLAVSVAALDGGRGYLAVGPSMEAEAEYYDTYSPGTISNLVRRLEISPYWKIWYKDGSTIIFQAFPSGHSANESG